MISDYLQRWCGPVPLPEKVHEAIVSDLQVFLRLGGTPTFTEWATMEDRLRECFEEALDGLGEEIDPLASEVFEAADDGEDIERLCREVAERIVE